MESVFKIITVHSPISDHLRQKQVAGGIADSLYRVSVLKEGSDDSVAVTPQTGRHVYNTTAVICNVLGLKAYGVRHF